MRVLANRRVGTAGVASSSVGTACAVERILRAGFAAPSLVAAWAVLDSVMRRRLRAEGEDAGWGTSPRTMLNELYSAGVLRTAFSGISKVFSISGPQSFTASRSRLFRRVPCSFSSIPLAVSWTSRFPPSRGPDPAGSLIGED
jgi:hypothetical protein